MTKKSVPTSQAKYAKTNYKTTASLNLRSGAGTNYKKVITVPKSKVVVSTESKGTWKKVSYSYSSKGKKVTKTGWVSGKYLKEYYKYTKTSGTYYLADQKSALYSKPDTKKNAVYAIQKNTGFFSTQEIINSKGQKWYRVSYKGKKFYIHSKDVKKQTKAKISKSTFVAQKDSILYSYYGVSHAKVNAIPKGTILTTSYRVGNWYKASYGGKTGYFYGDDFTIKQEAVSLEEEALVRETYATTASLNLRSTAGEEGAILATIPKGEIIIPTHKVSNGWYKVTYSGKTGYVSGKYIEKVRTGDPLTTRSGYQFIDLRTKSPVKAAQIDQYIDKSIAGKTSVLKGKGQAFIDAGDKYGVNALYLAAHAIHESAYGLSNISLGKRNLFGFGAFDAAPYVAAYRFGTVEQNIEYIAQEMKATYLNPGNWKYKGAYLGFSTKTLSNARVEESSEGMNFYYASDPYWGKAIAAHMERMLPYDKKYYNSVKPDLTVPAFPTKPAGSDKFPEGIKAVAKKGLGLSSKKGNNEIVKTLKKGMEFQLLEKTNDYWMKVKVEDEILWTEDIRLVDYKNYISVKNLGRVTAVSLNVRPSASTKQERIAVLKLNQYVHLALDQEGKIVTDSSKGWYKVVLADGTKGWVSAAYIIKELY
ncbi:SH3 domain-containing protein [Mesobacillus thioparans]|uniref:SH3 domain-containing protein n=1 Tax=Mesobacillus thioparans TaxID=370439 RepID=UPI0039EF8301